MLVRPVGIRVNGRHSANTTAKVGESEHQLLRMQRLAGNRAVTSLLTARDGRSAGPLPVQRQLKVTGTGKDITSMLALLIAASGLKLVHNNKSGAVTVQGAAGPAKSADLASRLTTIIDDPKRLAEVALGPAGPGDSMGAFPSNLHKPEQRIFIEQILALEKGAPGAGVAKLAHEITENFNAHVLLEKDPKLVDKQNVNKEIEDSHDLGVAAEDSVLGELQDAAGVARSGRRLSEYIAILGTRPAQIKRNIQVHENDYLVWDQRFGDPRGRVISARRAPIKQVAQFQLAGFANPNKAVPEAAGPFLKRVADLLSADRTASVVIRSYAVPSAAKDAVFWAFRTGNAIRDNIPDVEAASESRLVDRPVESSDINRVTVVVNRPDIP